jgi:hypothetical protein
MAYLEKVKLVDVEKYKMAAEERNVLTLKDIAESVGWIGYEGIQTDREDRIESMRSVRILDIK